MLGVFSSACRPSVFGKTSVHILRLSVHFTTVGYMNSLCVWIIIPYQIYDFKIFSSIPWVASLLLVYWSFTVLIKSSLPGFVGGLCFWFCSLENLLNPMLRSCSIFASKGVQVLALTFIGL